jgi:hypothetical protein
MTTALLGFASLAIVLGMSSCSKKGGTDTVDDEDGLNNPPSRVTDLAVLHVTPASATFGWTAPHGGSPSITAASYDLRYAASSIDGTSWEQAIHVADEPPPLPAGMQQTMLATGLPSDTTLYFALRSGNRISDLSPLTGLIYLHTLNLAVNAIADLSPLVANAGIGSGDARARAGRRVGDISVAAFQFEKKGSAAVRIICRSRCSSTPTPAPDLASGHSEQGGGPSDTDSPVHPAPGPKTQRPAATRVFGLPGGVAQDYKVSTLLSMTA